MVEIHRGFAKDLMLKAMEIVENESQNVCPRDRGPFYYHDVPDFTKQLTIIIDEDDPEKSARFTVPEDLLVEHSEFFKAACRNEWKEATSRVIPIPDVEVDVFRAYLYWIYKERVLLGDAAEEHSVYMLDLENVKFVLEALCKLWLLGDRLADSALRNQVIDTLMGILRHHVRDFENNPIVITPGLISLIWSSTTEDRTLRHLMIDFYAEHGWDYEIEPVIDQFDTGFKDHVMMRMMDAKQFSGPADPDKQPRCHYHDHDDQHPACPPEESKKRKR